MRILAATSAILIAAFVIACGSGSKKDVSGTEETKPTAKGKNNRFVPEFSKLKLLPLAEIEKAYEENKVNADEKYTNKWYKVSGEVIEITDSGAIVRVNGRNHFVIQMDQPEVRKLHKYKDVEIATWLFKASPDPNAIFASYYFIDGRLIRELPKPTQPQVQP